MKYPRELLTELHRQGFKCEWRSRGGGDGCVQYTKTIGDRKLELQLWEDGTYRVSHMYNDLSIPHGGRMSTHPSEFKTVDEMKAAINHELTRNDHPKRFKA